MHNSGSRVFLLCFWANTVISYAFYTGCQFRFFPAYSVENTWHRIIQLEAQNNCVGSSLALSLYQYLLSFLLLAFYLLLNKYKSRKMKKINNYADGEPSKNVRILFLLLVFIYLIYTNPIDASKGRGTYLFNGPPILIITNALNIYSLFILSAVVLRKFGRSEPLPKKPIEKPSSVRKNRYHHSGE